MVPWKESDERCGVEHALALQAVRAARQGGEKSVEGSEGTRLQLAKHRARRGLDPA